MHKDNLYEAFFTYLKQIYSLSRPAQYTYPKPLFDTWTPPTQRDEQEHHITIVQESETDIDSPSERENEEKGETPVQPDRSVSANANDQNGSDELSDNPIPLSASTPASTPASTLVSTPASTAASIPSSIPQAHYASTPTSIPTSNESVLFLNESPQPSTSYTCEVKDRFVTKRKKKAASTRKNSDWEIDAGASRQQAHPKDFLPMKRKEKKKTKSGKTQKKPNPYSKSAYLFEMSSDSDFQ